MLVRLLATAGVLALSAGAASAEYTLTILHINDFHARFEPINGSDSTCGEKDAAENKCFGGIARLVTAVTDARSRTANSLLIDAGDQFQGSLFYNHYKGKVSAEFMNALGFEAMAVGNHEFDDGPPELAHFLEQIRFPMVMANADLSREPLLKGRIAKSVVVEKAGEKIGIIGLTPLDNPELASPGPNIIFTPPADAVQAEVDTLTAAGVNKIIVLSHSGYEVDKQIAAETAGVDVIVGGHSHTLLSSTDPDAAGPYPTMVNGVPIVTAYAYGKYLGELTVTFDDAGKVISSSGAPLLLDASVAEDAPAQQLLAELAVPLAELRARVVAVSEAPIDGSRDHCRQQECEMGTLIADAQLDRMKDQGITISLVNGGGVRASIEAGDVTMGQVLTVLPFQNTLATFQTTGATVVAALENGVSQLDQGAGRFLQVAGLKYSFDPAKPAGSRVTDVQVRAGEGWAAIDPAASYGVVVNNYVRSGGDGFAMFTTGVANAYDFGPDLADVLADYLAKEGPYKPYIDGRITRK
ncbi:multifunctional 2',3'-cyclic-nucleotide 2'-phosphodiesterase/5'-nucleotidase/3'-nucleotidase [Haematobacter massiliensis]|uniref:5'-nucleotidase n=1 Tax=Haematobacter massiliensis TaxID=195105 RepID=A0A086YAP0_9RHOB|nr:bifunctional metallophosphatase/5'-nucleotidase [Haematobacter massiliensis]KFI31340.1 5'-nucleotidase [Haematobacter massiliensis]OWJ73654.1 multifunctional 2',3'-cyclic-nucleotide 2'-phosphodiesterase/5'-nucleotidase/3'-nucleotidase [Haematobacter massiliensis]OWJ81865.1 multifunctional 2',3'-cyclic-nucleotide 2'-phosphodiesterase/5'-nucleotidase/3'-nucleotidase [Haematobacter massiliensis]QBJ23414.1 multifunctional 2',3'-cyclic-nucleotide 2'-phosphodiesterase/5'-nucleotidase/3'-nucleotida